ncbi:MAG: hemerythrin domain-containing protein [Hydrogenophilales bacterium]|nr:hemerythrin domain-containing protein [Hydrogenophilales bacterium]
MWTRRDGARWRVTLAQFGDALRGHILKENIRLYVYLKHSLQGDEDSTAIVHQFSREMHHIGLAVTDFLTRYTGDRNWDDAQWSVFERDLKEVGAVLTRRIETEESILYPLYLPPGDYA